MFCAGTFTTGEGACDVSTTLLKQEMRCLVPGFALKYIVWCFYAIQFKEFKDQCLVNAQPLALSPKAEARMQSATGVYVTTPPRRPAAYHHQTRPQTNLCYEATNSF